MIRVGLCDDDPRELQQVYALLDEYGRASPADQLSISVYESPDMLIREVSARSFCDLYILDVQMPRMSGIALGQYIRERNDACLIIYQTVTTDYAFEAYSVSAFQYLLKPLSRERLFPVLDKAVLQLSRREEEGMVVKTAGGVSYVAYRAINYIEHRNRTMLFHMVTGQSITSLCLRESIDKTLAGLLADGRFLRPHKSYVVNMDHIRQYEGDVVVLESGDVLPVAKGKAVSAKKEYLDYLTRKVRTATGLTAGG